MKHHNSALLIRVRFILLLIYISPNWFFISYHYRMNIYFIGCCRVLDVDSTVFGMSERVAIGVPWLAVLRLVDGLHPVDSWFRWRQAVTLYFLLADAGRSSSYCQHQPQTFFPAVGKIYFRFYQVLAEIKWKSVLRFHTGKLSINILNVKLVHRTLLLSTSLTLNWLLWWYQ